MTISVTNKPEDKAPSSSLAHKSHRKLALAVTGIGVIAVVGAGAIVVNTIESPTSSNSLPTIASSYNSLESSAGVAKFTDTAELAQEDRATVIAGSLSLTVESPSETSASIIAIVTKANGRVDSSLKQPGNEYQPDKASLTLRIPSSSYTQTLAELEALGTVTYSNVNLSDVQTQVTQNDIRTESLRNSVSRLQSMLADAATTTDLIQIETELENRETELEILIASSSSLKDQVAYATLQVNLTSEAEAVLPEPESFASGFITGWDSLVGFSAAILVGAGIVLPWALALGVIGSIIYFFLRKRRTQKPRSQTESDLE